MNQRNNNKWRLRRVPPPRPPPPAMAYVPPVPQYVPRYSYLPPQPTSSWMQYGRAIRNQVSRSWNQYMPVFRDKQNGGVPTLLPKNFMSVNSLYVLFLALVLFMLASNCESPLWVSIRKITNRDARAAAVWILPFIAKCALAAFAFVDPGKNTSTQTLTLSALAFTMAIWFAGESILFLDIIVFAFAFRYFNHAENTYQRTVAVIVSAFCYLLFHYGLHVHDFVGGNTNLPGGGHNCTG